MDYFDTLEMAPPDPIMGLNEAFRTDPKPEKINLTAGVYQDAQGRTPIFAAVKIAEERLLERENSKSYLPIEGGSEFAVAVRELLLGLEHPINQAGRAVTAHTPGGTSALRVAGDFLRQLRPKAPVWISDPTWPNHPAIFNASGIGLKTYRYYDAGTHALNFSAMMDDLRQASPGDIVLLHGCCHNPSGVDPSPEQWEEIAGLTHRSGLLPLIDFAYQGLGEGVEADARSVRMFCEKNPEVLIASSFSKNFGLYNERTGALTLIAHTADAAKTALTHLKRAIRANYSNPPAHGAAIVTTILEDAGLRESWQSELTAMRERIHGNRAKLVETLRRLGANRDFSFLAHQNGMFSFSGLSKAQVDALREKHSIYMVGSGRMNVAGINDANLERLCEAIVSVL